MKYGDFPVFTRRYAHHGIENFAFDLLLGKPCLIVAHHDFFKDDYAALLRLLDGLRALNCSLQWQTLGAVVRKACRRRITGKGTEEVQMYSSQLSLWNAGEQSVQVLIQFQEADTETIAEIKCDGAPVSWRAAGGRCFFEATIPASNERLFQVSYRERKQTSTYMQSATFRSTVAARRFLSELRDASCGRFAPISLAAAKLRRVRK